jgi:hypothetical protein
VGDSGAKGKGRGERRRKELNKSFLSEAFIGLCVCVDRERSKKARKDVPKTKRPKTPSTTKTRPLLMFFNS